MKIRIGLLWKFSSRKQSWKTLPEYTCTLAILRYFYLFYYLSRKRAAEQKIKNYFFQLTDGCGVQGCSNEYCASSGRKQTSKDDAAALALQLFMKKARLCEPLQENNHKGNIHVKQRTLSLLHVSSPNQFSQQIVFSYGSFNCHNLVDNNNAQHNQSAYEPLHLENGSPVNSGNFDAIAHW